MSQAGRFYPNALISTLTGDVGGAIVPVAGNIDILGGTGVTVTGTPGTLTIAVTGGFSDDFPTDAGTATPDGIGDLNIFGGANINTTGAGNTVTVILDDDVTLSGQLEANEVESITYITAGKNITAVAGNISAVAGNITSGADMTAVGDITTVTGDLNATVGNLNIGGAVSVIGDIVSITGDVVAQVDVRAVTGDIISTAGAGDFATTVVAGGDITSTAGDIETLAGNISSSNTVTAGNGLIASAGGVLASAGNITATLGNIITSAGSIDSASSMSAVGNITTSTGNVISTLGAGNFATTVTAGGNITSTAGNLIITAGTIQSSGTISSLTGDVISSTGALSAATTVTAAGDITSSTGDIISTLGDIRAPNGTLYVATFSSAGDIVTTAGDLIATLGDVNVGNLVVAGNGMTASGGNITASVGDIIATSGSITAASNIASINGNINAANGDITAGYDLVAGADISATLGDITAEQGDITARYDIESVEGDIIAHAGDIQTIAGNINSGADLIALGNLDITGGTIRFRTVSNGALLADADGYVTASSTGFATFTGFDSWDGAGPYYDDTTLGEFDIVQSGTGYINSIAVSWTAPQTVTGMTAGNTYLIYIDDTGTIGKTTSFSQATFEDYVVLFECLRDSTGTNVQYTVKENHPSTMPVATAYYLHETIGTVIENHANGANITLNGTQKIEIVGADDLSDHGLYTDIADSGGVAVTWNQMYTNGAGKWATYQSSDTFNGYWNSAGTATAPTGNKYSIYRLYVSKDDLNSSTPTYWAVLDDAEYSNLAAAQNAVSNDTVVVATAELAKLEFAQLGLIIYQQSTSTIVDVIISKATVGSGTSGGGSSNDASLIVTDVTNFDGILSASDTTVQVALDTIDEWGKSTTDHAILIGNGTGTAFGSLAVGATGEMLIGNTGAEPTWSATGALTTLNATTVTATTVNATTLDTNVAAAGVTLSGTSLLADGTDADININITAKGTGKVIIDDLQLTTDLAVTEGGTGVSTLTDHGVILGSGAAAVTSLAEATDGQLIIGSTGNDPVLATLTAGTGISIAEAAGSITITNTLSAAAWTEVTGTTQAMAVNSRYILNNVALVTATLPTTAAVGEFVRVAGKGSGGWKIAQNAGEEIKFGTATTTNGATGYLASTDDNDCVELICIVANDTWLVLSSVGNITVA